MVKDTDVIIKKLYPIVSESLNKNSQKFIKAMSTFINNRHTEIFAIAPYDRIYFNANDKENLYRSLGFTEEQIKNVVKECFFWDIDYTPNAAKEPYVPMLMCCIRYYVKNSQLKNAELTTIYLAFTGKFYVSLHCYFWKKFPPERAVLDYVINNMLSDKYDIKREGTVFGAVKKLCVTWLTTYKTNLTKDLSDDDVGKLIQQLRDREKSFLKNIANLYFEAYNNKLYMNYETDSLNPDEFRITDNDAAKAAKYTESAMNKLTSQKVDLDLCNKCKNENVSSIEVKNIIEAILMDNENLPKLRRIINIIICDFMANNPGQRVGSVRFIEYTIKAKPNTKSKILIELKTTITNWLNEYSLRCRKSNREATKNNFYKSVLSYFTFIICKVAV